jgi:hypothetical protein
MSQIDHEALAKLGAERRLRDIEAETAKLYEVFPGLRDDEIRAKRQANAAKARAALAERKQQQPPAGEETR